MSSWWRLSLAKFASQKLPTAMCQLPCQPARQWKTQVVRMIAKSSVSQTIMRCRHREVMMWSKDPGEKITKNSFTKLKSPFFGGSAAASFGGAAPDTVAANSKKALNANIRKVTKPSNLLSKNEKHFLLHKKGKKQDKTLHITKTTWKNRNTTYWKTKNTTTTATTVCPS